MIALSIVMSALSLLISAGAAFLAVRAVRSVSDYRDSVEVLTARLADYRTGKLDTEEFRRFKATVMNPNFLKKRIGDNEYDKNNKGASTGFKGRPQRKGKQDSDHSDGARPGAPDKTRG